MPILLYLAVLLPFALVMYAVLRRRQAARQHRVLALRARIYGQGAMTARAAGGGAEARGQHRYANLFTRLTLLIEGGGFSAGQARGLLLAVALLLLVLAMAHLPPLYGRILTPGINLLLWLALASVPGMIAVRIIRQRREFIRQLPDAVEAMVRALEAGNSVEEAVQIIAADFPAPISTQFKLIARQLQLGLSFKEALINLRQRLPLAEVQYLVLALVMQRDTGGQLAKILAHFATLLRRRLVFQGKLKALTAETRFTALFISGLPLCYIGYRYFFNRAGMQFFLSDPTGLLLLQVSLGLILTGTIILKILMRIRF